MTLVLIVFCGDAFTCVLRIDCVSGVTGISQRTGNQLSILLMFFVSYPVVLTAERAHLMYLPNDTAAILLIVNTSRDSHASRLSISTKHNFPLSITISKGGWCS